MRLIFLITFLVAVLGINQFAPPCEKESDCKALNFCDIEAGICKHKDLMPLEVQEYAGTLIVLIMSALANAGGIGGSSIMIAIMLLIFNFETHMAIPIVQIIILSGSLVAVGLKFKNRHPHRDRPLILYELLMLEVAPLLLGSSVGVFLNIGFPTWLILAILILVTLILAALTFTKGVKIYKKESRLKELIRNPPTVTGETKSIDSIAECKVESNDAMDEDEVVQFAVAENAEPLEPASDNSSKEPSYVIVASNSEPIKTEKDFELQKMYAVENSTFLKWPLIIIAIVFAWAVAAAFLKGDPTVKSIVGFTGCSTNYWYFVAGYILSMLVITFLIARHLIYKNTLRHELKYNFDEHDMRWTKSNTFLFAFSSFIAGLISGLIGVSGGVVMGPIQLAFGLRPEVSAATSSCIVVLTSALNTILFMKAGLFTQNYSLWLGAFSIIGSFVGILVVKKIVEKKQRASIIVFILGSVYAAACVLILAYGITKLLADEKKGAAKYGFKPFC